MSAAGVAGPGPGEAAGRIAQRLVRHAEHVVSLIDDDLRRGGHARHQRQIAVVDADHGIIGDDVLHRLRRLADLGHGSLEDPLRVGIDGEGGLVAFLHAADVALADIGVDLHLLEVGGDQEQRRRLQAGRDGLALRHVAGDDRAVDRRDDIGVAEIELGAFDETLVELDGPFVLMDDIGLVLGLLAGDRVLRRELLIAREIDPVLVEDGLIAQQVGRNIGRVSPDTDADRFWRKSARPSPTVL